MDNELRNFLTECDLWEYSDDNYKIMKGITELTLIEKYIDNVNVDLDLAMSESVKLPDDFYMEGIGDTIKQAGKDIAQNAKDSVTQKATDVYMQKKEGILGKIVNIIKNVCSAIIRFITKVDETTAQYNKQSISLLERLRLVSLTSKDIKVLALLLWNKGDSPDVNAGAAGVQGKLPLSFRNITTVKQPFEDQLQLNLASDVPNDENLKAVKWALALALSTDTVVLNGEWATTFANEQTKQWPEAVQLSFLAQHLSDYLNAETLTQGAAIINNIKTHLTNGNAITINVGDNNAENDKKLLATLRDKISNTASGGPEIKIHPTDAKGTNELEDQLLFLRTCASQTLRMYQTYITARKNITSKLTAYLDAHYARNVNQNKN